MFIPNVLFRNRMITIWTSVTIISGCLYYYITDFSNSSIPENEEEEDEEEDKENEYEEDIQNKELSKSLE